MGYYYGPEDYYLQQMIEISDLIDGRNLEIADRFVKLLYETDIIYYLDQHYEEEFIKYFQIGYEEGTYDSQVSINIFIRDSFEDILARLDNGYIGDPNKVDNDTLKDELLILKSKILRFIEELKYEKEKKFDKVICPDSKFCNKSYDTSLSMEEKIKFVKEHYNDRLKEFGPNGVEIKVENAYEIGSVMASIDYFSNIKI